MGCYVIAKRKPGTDVFEFDNRPHEDIGDETCIFGNTEYAARALEECVARHGRDNVMLLQIMNVDVKVEAYAKVRDAAWNVLYESER